MKRLRIDRSILFLFLLLVFLVSASQAVAARRLGAHRSALGTSGLGLGFVLGDPTALSAKYWLTSTTAVDFGFGYAFGNSALLMADHLWHRAQIFGTSSRFVSQLTGYLGVGVLLAFGGDRVGRTFSYESNMALGARVPLGLEWLPGDPSLGVFLEIAPGIRLAPSVDAFFTGGIGLRYYF